VTQPQPETNAATVQAEGPSEFELLLQKPTQVKALKAPAEMLPPATKIPMYKASIFDAFASEYSVGTYSNRLYTSASMRQSKSSLHDLAPESFKQDVATGYVDYKEAINTILNHTSVSLTEAEDFVNELRGSGGTKRLCPVCRDPRCPESQ
jgi:hypothetical protein